MVQELKEIGEKLNGIPVEIRGVAPPAAPGVTGVVVGADVVKNEITAHAVAQPGGAGVQTVLELGDRTQSLS